MIFFQPSVISWHLITSSSLLPSYWLRCLLLIEAWLFFQNYNKVHKLWKMEEISLLLFLAPWLSGPLQSNSLSLLVYFKYHKQICCSDFRDIHYKRTLPMTWLYSGCLQKPLWRYKLNNKTLLLWSKNTPWYWEIKKLITYHSLGASHKHNVEWKKPESQDTHCMSWFTWSPKSDKTSHWC